MEHDSETAFLDALAKRLANLRKEKDLTQEKLAEMVGYDRVAIANIEIGLRRPTVITAYRLSKALDIKIEDLLKGLE